MFLERSMSQADGIGWIEVICGSMFSGKTEELIRRVRRAKIANQKVKIFKPIIDSRSKNYIESHDENKIKEIATKINKSKVLDWEETYNDAKEIFELAVIYKYLSKSKRNSDWVFYSEKLKETLRQLDLSSEKNDELTNNESEIIPLIDSIKDLVTEIPESGDDK